MLKIPKTLGFDNTMAFLRAPYDFVTERCALHHTDLFQTRLLLRKTICMRGEEESQLFYDPQHFIRKGAAPEPIRATLFGKGGIQGTDGEIHRKRKQIFTSF